MVGLMVLGLVAVVGCDNKAKTQKIDSGSNAADATSARAQTPPDHPRSDHPTSDHPTSDHPTADHPSGAAGEATLAGVTFAVPANWQDVGSSGMRQAQYRLDPVGSDAAQGEVNVFYFGPASGGGVEANLNRWIGQMVMPDGSDPAAGAERGSFKADGMAGHIVSLNGTYKSGGGRPMGGETTMLPDYRLVGVVVEGPQGSLFFKLTGPLATAQAMESDLLTMVKGAHK